MKQEIVIQSLGIHHPSVQEVIRIAEDMMNKNQVLNIDNLYEEAKRILKLPKTGLLSIIQFLINKKILIEGTKFSKKTVLMNQTRNQIYQFIQKKGAVHFSHIRKSIQFDIQGKEIGSGQLIWHLEMLYKFNYIKKIKYGNFSVFLPIEIEEESGFIIFMLNDEINRKIIEALIISELIKRSELYSQLSEKKENIYYHLNMLINYDIISVKQDNEDELTLNLSKKNSIKRLLKEFF